jgi:acylphosphatase
MRRTALIKSAVCRVQSEAAVPQEHRAKRFYVSGVVQGVGYRYFAKGAAQRLGVAGYAKNLRDGRVEVYAIGTDVMFTALHAELSRGPRAAVVSGVSDEDAAIEAEYEGEFSIEHGTF